ncbi:MAG TPA: DUF4249 family protein [Flavilitoribacter sp.]|nr:DUF4249 family protein [Flavilitoribacter sp.]
MKRIFIPLFSIMTIFWACEPESVTTTSTGTPVIQGYLYAGQPVDSILITLSNSYSDSDTVTKTLDNLIVTLSDNNLSQVMQFDGNGVYSAPDRTVESGKTYSLSFEWEGRTVTAQTYIPEKQEAAISTDEIYLTKISAGSFPGNFGDLPDPIEVTWSNPAGDYYYVVVKNIEENPEYVNEIFGTGELMNRRFTFISKPGTTDYYSIDPRREIRQFGTHQIIVYRVNPEYAALYETSNATSQSITEPPSNVDNGLGVFTGVSSDTLILEVRKN